MQFLQTPIFCDVARFFAYPVKQTATQNAVTISTAGGSVLGSISLKPQVYFVAFGLTCFTNYDNVSPVAASADSDAILPGVFAPNNFTVTISRGLYNNYSNNPIPQAMLGASGYRAGKVFPYPVAYSPRSNFQFTFQDTTGLFLLDDTTDGQPVPLVIQMFLQGYNVPIEQWDKFCRIFPAFANVFSADSGL